MGDAGARAVRLIVASPPSPSAWSTSNDLPQSWVAGHTFLEFPDADTAERWRNSSSPPLDDGWSDGDTNGRPFSRVFAYLYFRIAGTWRVTVPPSALERLVARALGRGLRQLGVPGAGVNSLARGTVLDGVRIRPLGWVLVGLDREGQPPTILASYVLAGGLADRAAVTRSIEKYRSLQRTLRLARLARGASTAPQAGLDQGARDAAAQETPP
jgi:hypothetical protein